MRRFLPVLAALSLLVPQAAPASVDPLAVADQDFARHRDPALWTGLSVERRVVPDGAATWALWRIANTADADGPLWVVPHDNEHGAFAAALAAVKRWGGVMIAVDSGAWDEDSSARYVRAADGRALDPNRSFTEAWPAYVAAVLADLGSPARPIIALHTNPAGFDPGKSDCALPVGGTAGAGSISVRLCNAVYTPRPAATPRWPFDDDDSLAIVPHLAGQPADAGWCAAELAASDVNLSHERVSTSDGSLSNYAVGRGLAYLNFETRDRGAGPAQIGEARDRLLAMIGIAMRECGVQRPTLLAAATPVMGAR